MRLALAVLAAGLMVPVSGCLACEPELEVYHCRAATGRCDPAGGPTVAWNPDLAGLFPDVARLLAEVPPGKHAHAGWTEARQDAFWSFYQVDPDAEAKQVFLTTGNGTAQQLFQVRVLEC